MIIAKPFDTPLLESDLNKKCFTESKFTKYSLCYASPEFPNEDIGFINCEDDLGDFLHCLDWLNENKLSALINYDTNGTKKILLPKHINSKLAITYDNMYSKGEGFLKSLTEVTKTIDSLDDSDILWMLEETLDMDETAAMMKSDGSFIFLNKKNFKEFKGVNYGEYTYYNSCLADEYMNGYC